MMSPTDELELASPAAEPVQRWFPHFMRAIKACRFYPEGSSARDRNLEQAYTGLEQVLRGQPQIVFDVRAGRLYLGSDRVHTDPEKDGLAQILFASSIFQLVLLDGVTAEELTRLAEVLSIDFNQREHAGEDLVTALWRLDLPHVRYRNLDLFTAAVRLESAGSGLLAEIPKDEETARLQQQIERVVAKLSPGLDNDEASRADNSFEIAVDLFRRSVPAETINTLSKELPAHNEHRDLAAHLVGLLIDALRSEERPTDPSPALDFLLRLFEGMISAAQYGDATKLVLRLQEIAQRSRNTVEQSFAQRLLSRFASDHEIGKAVETLNAVDRSSMGMKVIAYLRALDHYAASALLSRVDQIIDPLARQMASDLLLQITAMHRDALVSRMTTLRFEVVCDLLERSRTLHQDERIELVLRAVEHPHPKARVEALRQLKAAERGRADEAIARAIHDCDPTVRSTALNVASMRRSPEALREIANILAKDELVEHEPREMKQLMTAYGSIAGERGISELLRLLEHPGSILHLRRSAAVRTAAAAGLRAIRSEAARSLLEKGARSLHIGVRSACRAALEGEEELLASRPALSGALPRVASPPPLFIPRTDAPPAKTPPPSIKTPPPTIARTIGRGMHLLASPAAQTPPPSPLPRPLTPPADQVLAAEATAAAYYEEPVPRLPSNALIPMIVCDEET
jgi:hypothetical protein